MSDPGISYLFRVSIDGLELGVFTKVEGLNVKYHTDPIKEGGQNSYVHTLAGRVIYETVKLTRPIDKDSSKLAAWFGQLHENVSTSTKTARRTAVITAFGPSGAPIAEWNLAGVCPVSYRGPSLQAGQAQVVTETIEFAHSGFESEGFSVSDGGRAASPSGGGGRRSGSPAPGLAIDIGGRL